MCAGGLVQIWQNLGAQSVSAFVDLTGQLLSSACKFLKTVSGYSSICTFPVFVLMTFSNYPTRYVPKKCSQPSSQRRGFYNIV